MFSKNTARYGGALSILESDDSLIYPDNIFVYNAGDNIGGAVLSRDVNYAMNCSNNSWVHSNFDSKGIGGISQIFNVSWVLRTYNFYSNLNLIDVSYDEVVSNPNITSLNNVYTKSNITGFFMEFPPGHPFPLILELSFYHKNGSKAVEINNYNFTTRMTND